MADPQHPPGTGRAGHGNGDGGTLSFFAAGTDDAIIPPFHTADGKAMKREGSGQAGGREDLGDPHHRQSHPGQGMDRVLQEGRRAQLFPGRRERRGDVVPPARRRGRASCAGWASSSRRSICRSGVARSPLASLARPCFFLGEPVLAARLGRLAAVRRVAPTGQANGQQGQPGIQGMSAGGAVGRVTQAAPRMRKCASRPCSRMVADLPSSMSSRASGRADARARRPVARRH